MYILAAKVVFNRILRMRSEVTNHVKSCKLCQCPIPESRALRHWASDRSIEIVAESPYDADAKANRLTERLIRVRETIDSSSWTMYPSLAWDGAEADMRGGRASQLTSTALSTHGTIVCFPKFAPNGTSTRLSADNRLEIFFKNSTP